MLLCNFPGISDFLIANPFVIIGIFACKSNGCNRSILSYVCLTVTGNGNAEYTVKRRVINGCGYFVINSVLISGVSIRTVEADYFVTVLLLSYSPVKRNRVYVVFKYIVRICILYSKLGRSVIFTCIRCAQTAGSTYKFKILGQRSFIYRYGKLGIVISKAAIGPSDSEVRIRNVYELRQNVNGLITRGSIHYRTVSHGYYTGIFS